MVTTDGSIAGDRSVDSVVQLRNRLWFSYPGYAEILSASRTTKRSRATTRCANRTRLSSNDYAKRLSLPSEKVATFASWSVFNAIAEHVEGSTVVNAGIEPVDSPDPDVRLIDGLQGEAKPPVGRHSPRRLHIPPCDAPSGRCASAGVMHCVRRDRRLGARRPLLISCSTRYTRIDGYLRELWEWVQAQPEYRGHTHLLITTDHGRGKTRDDWRTHGQKAAGSEDVWIALRFFTPEPARRVERRAGPHHQPDRGDALRLDGSRLERRSPGG